MGLLVFVTEKQLSPGFEHVPLYVVGQHTEKDVSPHPRFQMMKDGPHLQVDGFEGPESAFHMTRQLITTHGVLRAQALRPKAGSDHIDSIQGSFGCNLLRQQVEGKATIADFKLKVFGYTVLVRYPAHPQTNFICALELATGHQRCTFSNSRVVASSKDCRVWARRLARSGLRQATSRPPGTAGPRN